jgi:uncharacterized protein
MKLTGTYTISAPRPTVWQSLMDPAVLACSLPGCEKMETQPDGTYRAELKVGIGAVKGSYHGHIEVVDGAPPERYRIKVQGEGRGGFVQGEGLFTLAENGPGSTLISYSGEAQVGGVIASVGQRLLEAAAKQTARKFFDEFARQVASAPSTTTSEVAPLPQAAAPEAAPPESPPAPTEPPVSN